MGCQRCDSNRLVSVLGKCSDCCAILCNGHEHNGYVPQGVLGGSDYLKFWLCAECGQMQGKFPALDSDFGVSDTE